MKIYREGSCNGEVLVSNLQTLFVLASTEYFPDIGGKVLFIEESEDVRVPMIHRFFTQLSLLKGFNQIKRLVIGKFMEDSEESESNLEVILNEISGRFEDPVLFNSSFGHTDPIYTIPNGGRVKIDTNSSDSIRFFN